MLLRSGPIAALYALTMKMFLLLALSVIALFVWQRQAPESAPTAKTPLVAPATATAPRPVSEHNWAKHSLDRAHQVVGQVQQLRAENDPR